MVVVVVTVFRARVHTLVLQDGRVLQQSLPDHRVILAAEDAVATIATTTSIATTSSRS